DLRRRLVALFTVGSDGRRPCFGFVERFRQDPAWKDNLVFNEYFHGDNGAGLGASHQTGWTGVVADLIRGRPGDAVYAAGDVRGLLRDRREHCPSDGSADTIPRCQTRPAPCGRMLNTGGGLVGRLVLRRRTAVSLRRHGPTCLRRGERGMTRVNRE